MKNLLFLCVCLLSSSCTTETVSTAAPSKQTLPNKETPPLVQENIYIGMPRAEAERILGCPTSVTDTAMGTTAVWVFSPGASKVFSIQRARTTAMPYSPGQ